MVLLTSDLRHYVFCYMIKLLAVLSSRKTRPYMRGNQVNEGSKNILLWKKKKKKTKVFSAKMKSEIRDKSLKDDLLFFPLHILVLNTVKNIKFILFFANSRENV